ncbi:hypothetical protein [Nocardiopsis synnemataformans]|uniref:hypothetical protein n=1 Tax=Nocardiopsis synnemataformans TaxID=61305 RepID=UPI003EBBAE33
MGRQVRRVPLSFDWPLGQAWEGFLMPKALHLPPCPDCRHGEDYATGYSREAWAVHATFYPLMISGSRTHGERLAWCDKLGQVEVDHLVAEGRLRQLRQRVPTEDNPRTWEWTSVPRTAAEVNAANGRGTPMLGDLHHDGVNRMILVRHRCELLGINMACPTCGGNADVGTPEQRAAHEGWRPTDPPTGEGWQLWETVSEGSPISPVFPSSEGLVAWMSDPERGDAWLPPPVAAKFVADGWAPSFVATPVTGVVSGVEYVGMRGEEAP